MSSIKIDGSKVRFWATKAQAIQAAKAIGWPLNSVWRVHTRFTEGYALYTNNNSFLSREEYGALYSARNGAAA